MSEPRQINLSKVIWSDLMSHFWLVLLVLAVLFSALAVVYSAHQNRMLIGHWEELHQQRDQLKLEARHLLLEEMALAEHSRIEQLAMDKLGMNRPKTEKEIAVHSQ
ncbi:cell division protein FtsL [Psychrobium sp. 1_MG-2023]|uniref:cell division protein FtsL n=1 Tax=Psychrobium sp. 1_MG-2023 TaxID=3062624 RepID=UPI000C347B20|nr:cell division protein FtsL [Psychrobium sp. 1_MG-2023]MDP2561455.1 cell division protein FtsL [Psychrobium sp. 1_MG-2023]PKF57722.1 cell division protein FtsL [Alteromonadales bacterium alter-6D02]